MHVHAVAQTSHPTWSVPLMSVGSSHCIRHPPQGVTTILYSGAFLSSDMCRDLNGSSGRTSQGRMCGCGADWGVVVHVATAARGGPPLLDQSGVRPRHPRLRPRRAPRRTTPTPPALPRAPLCYVLSCRCEDAIRVRVVWVPLCAIPTAYSCLAAGWLICSLSGGGGACTGSC